MNEYVTKEQVKREILSWARCIRKPEFLVTEDAIYVIDSLEPADVRHVAHGEWKKTSKNLSACSVCGNCILTERVDSNFYCPCCGARMGAK